MQRIPFYEDLTTYLDDTAIQEVVLTNKTVSILSTEIVDIAFVFKADEVKPFLSDCCRRGNVFVVYFQKNNRNDNILSPIVNWKPFSNENCYPYQLWYGLQSISREICTCLWSSYKATKWSRSISLSNEVWSYLCYALKLLCDVEKRKLRR